MVVYEIISELFFLFHDPFWHLLTDQFLAPTAWFAVLSFRVSISCFSLHSNINVLLQSALHLAPWNAAALCFCVAARDWPVLSHKTTSITQSTGTKLPPSRKRQQQDTDDLIDNRLSAIAPNPNRHEKTQETTSPQLNNMSDQENLNRNGRLGSMEL